MNPIKRSFGLILLTVFMFDLLTPTITWALSGSPTSPEASGFAANSQENMVDLFTGDFQYNIPLLDIEGYPINLSYNSQIRMDQEASWVGLGWNLNPGSIARVVNGLPDDFNGKNRIATHTKMKDHRVIRIKTGVGIEVFGKQGDSESGNQGDAESGNQANLSLSLAILHDNYRGLGYELGANLGTTLGVSEDFGASVGYYYSSFSGANFSFNTQLKGLPVMNNLIGGNISTRAGLQSVQLGYADLTGGFGRGYTVTPRKGPQTKTSSFACSFALGVDAIPVNGQVEFTGSQTTTTIEQGRVSAPAYGYMYLQNAKSKNALMDFNREKVTLMNKNAKNLHSTQLTHDLFQVNGQGLSASFRPYRSDIPTVKDPDFRTSKSNSTNVAGEMSGGTTQIGVNASRQTVTEKSYGWKTPAMAFLKWGARWPDANKPLAETVYFMDQDEIHSDPYNRWTELKENDPLSFESNGSITSPVAAFDYKNDRYDRNKSFAFLTAKQAEEVGRSLKLNSIGYEDKDENVNDPITDFDVWRVDPPNQPTPPTQITGRKADHLSEITITREDGQRYVYGLPVYNKVKKEVVFNAHGGDQDNTLIEYETVPANSQSLAEIDAKGRDNFIQVTTTPGYAESFLLTEVLSDDYVDRTNNGISSDDLGSAVEFGYSRTSDSYKWRIPYREKYANFQRGASTNEVQDDQGVIQYGEKELWYLTRIQSKNYEARFVLANREDGLGVKGRHGGQPSPITNKDRTKRLVRIDLYSRADLQINGISGATPIKSVHFKYDYSLCEGVDNNSSQTNLSGKPNYTTTTNNGGKLTLKEVYFTYGASSRGEDNKYFFTYNGFNADYEPMNVDHWGNYGVYSDDDFDIFPYSEQDAADQDEWADNWKLTSIRTPENATIDIEYESDRYRFVQNKRATVLVDVVGASNTQLYSTKKDDLYDGTTNHNYLFFPFPSSISNASDPDEKEEALEQAFEGIHELYFKFFVDLSKDNGTADEYVRGWAQIESVGICPDNNSYGYVQVASEPISDVQTGSCHVISKNGWAQLRNQLPELLYPLYSPNSGAGIVDVLTSLAGIVTEIIDFATHPYRSMRQKERARAFDISGRSRIKIPILEEKLGGGSRVKRISISDNWGGMDTPNGSSHTYITDYTYETEEGKCSGVASYEPVHAGEENPFKTDASFALTNRLSPDMPIYQEGPFGEMYFPSARVGYSRVVVSTPQPSLGTPTPTLNYAKGTGKMVHEFYTTRDFPTRVERSRLDRYYDPPLGATAFFPLGSTQESLKLTQGHVVETNNMNGKPKAVWNFPEGVDQPLTGTEYVYHTSGSSAGTAGLDLSNTVSAKDRNTVSSSQMGVTTDFVVDHGITKSTSVAGQLQGNIEFAGGFPILNIHNIGGGLNTSEAGFISTTKHVHRRGLLKKVISYDQGSRTETHNDIYDRQTGSVLSTHHKNEFNDQFYSGNLLARMAYPEMDAAALNENMLTRVTKVSGTNGIYELSTPLISSSDLKEVFIPGDEVYLWNSTDHKRLWVNQVNSNQIWLIDRYGTPFSSSASGSSIKILRSGHRNKIQDLIYNLVSPLNLTVWYKTNTSIPKVLDAQAVEYSDKWSYFCRAGDNRQQSKYNPYLTGEKGRWKAEMNWAYLTTRKNTYQQANGMYERYMEFWWYNTKTHLYTPTPYYSGWVWQTRSDRISAYGNPVSELNALGRFTSQQWEYNRSFVTAKADNAKYQHFGVDNYDAAKYDMNLSSGTFDRFRPRPASYSNDCAHTGTYSLKVNPNTSAKYDLSPQPCTDDNIICISQEQMRIYLNLFWNSKTGAFNYAGFTHEVLRSKDPKIVAYVQALLQSMVDFESTSGMLEDEFCFPACPCEQIPVHLSKGSKNNPDRYLASVWVHAPGLSGHNIDFAQLELKIGSNTFTASPVNGKSPMIEGWQLLELEFRITNQSHPYTLKLKNTSTTETLYFDDLRLQPLESNLVAYVYDPVTLRLVAELDANNFATFYQYDEEGRLTQIKKETERGIYTIEENNYFLKANN